MVINAFGALPVEPRVACPANSKRPAVLHTARRTSNYDVAVILLHQATVNMAYFLKDPPSFILWITTSMSSLINFECKVSPPSILP